MSGSIRIGTSGFVYRHWKGDFYPEDLPTRTWFEYFAARFDTVELNNTFYRLPLAQTFRNWRLRAPANFCFAVKFSRYGSHVKRLNAPAGTIRRFVTRARHLGPHLGPILLQLPPHWDAQSARLDAFLRSTPAGCRWAVEFRDRRWLNDTVYEILARHHAALCVHDLIPDHPQKITADWTYIRYHGQHYGGSYPSDFLEAEARRIVASASAGLDVYAYFNNDIGGHAVRNAQELRARVDQAGPEQKAGRPPEAA